MYKSFLYMIILIFVGMYGKKKKKELKYSCVH